MIFKFHKLCFFLNLFLFTTELAAQDVDSIMAVYEDKFNHEKIHFHLDKAVYNKSETVWYKVYLLTGSGTLVNSKNLYIDWFDEKGKLLSHHALPIFGSSAQGNFEIPAEYSYQSLHIRAYTKWMTNFDSSFLFEKDILVNQPKTSAFSSTRPITKVQLFPEGGNLVNGISSRIAFSALDPAGYPVVIKGALFTDNGDFIDSFAEQHSGMGMFELQKADINQAYYINWIDEYGQAGRTELPIAKNNGAVIKAQIVGSNIKVMIERGSDNSKKLRTLYLLAHMNQQLLYKGRLNLENRISGLTELNTVDYPSGILNLTVFDAAWQPLCERIVFVNNRKFTFQTSLDIVNKSMEARGKNVLEIEVMDSAIANMSIAVTDAELTTDDNTIISQFLLSGELRGRIYNPSSYFANTSDSTLRNLDLVMLTHGWRKFNWEDLINAKLPVISYPMDTAYLTISGEVTGKQFIAMDQNERRTMTIVVSNKNTGQQMIPVELNEGGTFQIGGLQIFDTAQVYFKFPKKNLTTGFNVEIGNNLISPLKPYPDLSKKNIFKYSDSIQFLRENFLLAEHLRLQKIKSNTTLKEVTVFSKIDAKTRIDSLNEKFTSGAFSGSARFNGDILSDPTAYSYPNIFMYLEAKVPGLSISPPSQNRAPVLASNNLLKPPSNFYDVLLRGETPYIYLNEILSEIDVLVSIPMSDIAYIKVFSSGFFGSWGNGLGGAISVYTKRGFDEDRKQNEPDFHRILTGYTKFKEFTVIDYSDSVKTFKPDTRSTVYWNPYIVTDSKNRKIRLEFYNNDISRRLRVVLEGLNENGKFVRLEKILE